MTVGQSSLFGDEDLSSRLGPRWHTGLADPPWLELGGGGRGAQNHYPLASVGDIAHAMMFGGAWNPATDAHLWLWYTDNFLQDALWLVDRLGFRYVRQFIWVKVAGEPAPLDLATGHAFANDTGSPEPGQLGLGQYGRGLHEAMLLCVRGSGMAPAVYNHKNRDVPSVIFAPTPRDGGGARIHSRKPEASYALIEARSNGPRQEFFARAGRPGWAAWGNEAPKDEAP